MQSPSPRSSGTAKEQAILTRRARHIFRTWYLATHPGGTVKINDLVDSNLKTEYENLYVCDCSVIPFSWGLPPMLTLICLGKRLAKHLKGQKTGGRVVKNPFVDI
jgi:choline dehydrogenase-like flavoprotein